MREEAVVEKFYELAKEAERIDSELLEQPVEPIFDAVLTLVMAHPEARAALGAAFLDIADNPEKGPPCLVDYCMHALRWEEVRNLLSARLKTEGSERVRHMLRKHIASFEDDWDVATMYRRFTPDDAVKTIGS